MPGSLESTSAGLGDCGLTRGLGWFMSRGMLDGAIETFAVYYSCAEEIEKHGF